MKARRLIGWLLLIGGAAYGITKAGPVFEQIGDNGLAVFGLVLIGLLILMAIARILNS